MRPKSYVTTLFMSAIIGMMALFAIGAASAEAAPTAFVQASQLQLNIEQAISVGNAAIAKLQVNGTDITNLSTTINALQTLANSLDPNSTTIDQVQQDRTQAMSLVGSFRQQASTLLTPQDRQLIREQAIQMFVTQHQQTMDAIKNMREAINSRNLNSFIEAQQRIALGLNASDNVSAVPELEDKLSDIREKIMNDNLSSDELAQMRTEIKASAQSLKANRTQVVKSIRVAQLNTRVDALNQLIANATNANISDSDLVSAHDSIVALLTSYNAGTINGSDFASQAQTLLQSSLQAMQNPSYASLHVGIPRYMMNERVDLRNQINQSWQNWTTQRRDGMMQINQTRGDMRELRNEIMSNQSAARGDLRQVSGALRNDGPGLGIIGGGRMMRNYKSNNSATDSANDNSANTAN